MTVDCYASIHDVGRVLNPIIVEGQIRGGFAHGFGAAMFEELSYDDNGNFLSGSFADYLCPNASDLPHLEFAYYRTDTPTNPLGSKGMGDGSSMLTPVVMANAVADALGCEQIDLPLTLNKVWKLVQRKNKMKPAAFDYYCPDTIEETVNLLSEYGDDSLLLAGGLSLGAMLNMRIARPSVLIDINKVKHLDNIIKTDGHLKIGALVRQGHLTFVKNARFLSHC